MALCVLCHFLNGGSLWMIISRMQNFLLTTWRNANSNRPKNWSFVNWKQCNFSLSHTNYLAVSTFNLRLNYLPFTIFSLCVSIYTKYFWSCVSMRNFRINWYGVYIYGKIIIPCGNKVRGGIYRNQLVHLLALWGDINYKRNLEFAQINFITFVLYAVWRCRHISAALELAQWLERERRYY